MAVLGGLAAVLGFALALGWACMHRGPWYDEFYAWHITRPERGFIDSLRTSWMADNHPPLFYTLAWLRRLLGGTIAEQRLINFAFLATTLAGAALLLRGRRWHWVMAAGLALVLAGHPAVMQAGSELRSYFLSTTASALLVLALTCIWIDRERATRSGWLVLLAASVMAFNTHIITSVIAGALFAPFLGFALLRRDWPMLRRLALPALAGGSIFLLTCALQAARWKAQTAVFWIPGGFNAARWSMEYAVIRTVESNWVVALAGVAGGIALLAQAWQARRLTPRLEAMLLFAVGCLLAAALLFALHMLRPLVIERYLVALIAPMAIIMALGMAALVEMLPSRGAMAVLVLATPATFWSIDTTMEQALALNSWTGTARLIAREVRTCPGTVVHTDPDYWNAWTMTFPPADNRPAIFAAYQLMAEQFGFRTAPLASRRIASPCPTLFWAEHDTRRDFDAAHILARLQAQGFAVQRIWQYRVGDGWVAADRPLSPMSNP